MLLEIGLLVTALLAFKWLNTKQERILGIYSRPGPFYWIKWIIFYLLYRWRTMRMSRSDNSFDDGSDLRYMEDEGLLKKDRTYQADFGAGERCKAAPSAMERPQCVADSHFAIDAVYFNAFESKTASIRDDVTVIMGFAMRYRNYAEILFLMNVPGVGFLQHPSHPDRIICDAWSDDYAYHGQGITIEMLEPMRRWRIKYNGLMRLMRIAKGDRKVEREQANGGCDKLIHVKFSLIWRSYSEFTDFDSGISASCMANAFALQEWNRDFFNNVKKYHSHQTHYEQWGQLKGIIHVEGRDPQEVLLRGLRDHSYSKRDWRHFHRYLICNIHLEDGTSINATVICMDVTISRFSMGYIMHPNYKKEDITDIDLKLWEHGENGVIPKEISFNFTAGGQKYSVFCQIRITPKFLCGFEWEGKVVENLADYHVNGIPGRGIAEMYYRHKGDKRTMLDCPQSVVKRYDEPKMDTAILENLLALKFEESLCKKATLVGGKGSQLALLKLWSLETDKFIVPDGFCITTSSYQRHVKQNPKIEQLLNEAHKIPVFSDDEVKDICHRIGSSFEDSTLSDSLRKAIEENCIALNHKGRLPVAVRSSAVGEDSLDLSAAGQLESFIGVKGTEDVLRAVKKCWSCLYSYNAVQYRRQHGQPIISTMGVVIQLLAENTQTSGVMFTQHPVTGHPAQTMINSNYGLGETVVSGSAEPDTIVVSCSPNNNPEILSKYVGTKAQKMMIHDSGNVEKVTVESDKSSCICVTEEQVFRLVEIGRIIQSNFGSPRDIEWAISGDGAINLLQARPITSDPTETEFEISREFDSAYSNNNYVLTTANISENLNGAVTPLTGSLFVRSIEYSTQMFLDSGSPRGFYKYNDVIVNSSHGHLFLNYLEMLRLHDKTMLGTRKESLDVSLFGNICTRISKDEASSYHKNFASIPARIRNTITFWKYLLQSKKQFKEVVEGTKKLSLEGENSKELYRVISENLESYAEGWRSYLAYAGLSGISNTLLMMILSRGSLDWKTDHYSDVAMIYRTCENVVSVSAPTLLREVAKRIHESDEKETFVNASPKSAIEWLLTANCDAGIKFKEFLQKCGHRCVRETELREASWACDPTKLGRSLQAMVKNYIPEPPKEVTSVEEAISKIKTPLTAIGKQLMKWAIPRARKSVAGREWGKSNSVKISDKFKRAYRSLAGMMEREGFLPDSDLMYFLTHGEIGKLLRTRSARLVTRALKRKMVHHRASQLVFADMSDKIPVEPVNCSNDCELEDLDLKIQGFPVSHGVVKGTARVVLSLQDANDIKQGDILIVRTTDVGWSPYFPLLSGLVTEIGGLISHGAVVAREYGLPCIVGAKRATQLFKTGDRVRLDGGRAIIQKIDSE